MAYKKGGLETGYYGKRVVVYVAVEVPGRNPSKHLAVYGYSFPRVLKVIRKALQDAFGGNGAVVKYKKARPPAPTK